MPCTCKTYEPGKPCEDNHKALPVVQTKKGCTCGSEEITPHSCPYQGEINNDYESLCTCCEVCEGNCADDI